MEVVWLERVANARSHRQQVQSQVYQTTHNFQHRFTVARVSFSRCHTCMSMITRVKANHWETLVPSFRIQPWSLPLCFLLGFLEWRRCDRGTLWTEPFCVSSICLCWRQVTPEGWAVNQRSTAAGTARLNVCSYAHYLYVYLIISTHTNSDELLLSFPRVPSVSAMLEIRLKLRFAVFPALPVTLQTAGFSFQP